VVLELTNFCKAMAEKVKEEKVMLETFMAVKVLAGATLAKWGEEEEGEGVLRQQSAKYLQSKE
jgi:hypothetical protein